MGQQHHVVYCSPPRITDAICDIICYRHALLVYRIFLFQQAFGLRLHCMPFVQYMRARILACGTSLVYI